MYYNQKCNQRDVRNLQQRILVTEEGVDMQSSDPKNLPTCNPLSSDKLLVAKKHQTDAQRSSSDDSSGEANHAKEQADQAEITDQKTSRLLSFIESNWFYITVAFILLFAIICITLKNLMKDSGVDWVVLILGVLISFISALVSNYKTFTISAFLTLIGWIIAVLGFAIFLI